MATRIPEEEIQEKMVLSPFRLYERLQEVKYPTCVFLGKRRSGKTFTALEVSSSFTHIERWAAWCGTRASAAFWAKAMGSFATINGVDEEGIKALKKVIKYQQEKQFEYEQVRGERVPSKYAVGIILDDVTYQKNFTRQTGLIDELFSNGRHLLAPIIVCCQYPKQLTPAVRSNLDFMFMSHNSKSSIKTLYEEWVDNVESPAVFRQILTSVIGKKERGADGKLHRMYYTLVFDATQMTHSFETSFSYFKPSDSKIIETMKLGSPEWREYVKTNYKNPKVEAMKKRIRKQLRHEEKQRMHTPQDSLMSQYQENLLHDESSSEEDIGYETIKGKRNTFKLYFNGNADVASAPTNSSSFIPRNPYHDTTSNDISSSNVADPYVFSYSSTNPTPTPTYYPAEYVDHRRSTFPSTPY